jgi:hypothetical protein
VFVDSEDRAHNHLATMAIDGNPETFWHTPWGAAETGLPHEIQIDLQKPTKLKGLLYLPRQDLVGGRIASYAVYVSEDGKQWGNPVANGKFAKTGDMQKVLFSQPRQARFIRLVALSEVGGHKWAAIAELDIIADN